MMILSCGFPCGVSAHLIINAILIQMSSTSYSEYVSDLAKLHVQALQDCLQVLGLLVIADVGIGAAPLGGPQGSTKPLFEVSATFMTRSNLWCLVKVLR